MRFCELPESEKKKRSKKFGEVQTPSRIVKKMVAACDVDPYDSVLEICCGEAPFLADLYDLPTGYRNPVGQRGGVLDVKMHKLMTSPEASPENALKVLKSCYGYEFQRERLAIGRINVFMDFMEHIPANWATDDYKREAMHIIRINLIQADGLTGLDDHGVPAKFYDWENKEYFLLKEES